MRLHVCMPRVTCAWAIVLGLVLLVMAGPTSAQPVDIPATWGGDFWSRPRLTGSWGGLRDELGKKGVVLDVDLLQTLQGVASGGRNEVATYWGTAEYTLNVDTQKLGLWPGGFLQSPGPQQLRPKHQSCLRGPHLAQLYLALAGAREYVRPAS